MLAGWLPRLIMNLLYVFLELLFSYSVIFILHREEIYLFITSYSVEAFHSDLSENYHEPQRQKISYYVCSFVHG